MFAGVFSPNRSGFLDEFSPNRSGFLDESSNSPILLNLSVSISNSNNSPKNKGSQTTKTSITKNSIGATFNKKGRNSGFSSFYGTAVKHTKVQTLMLSFEERYLGRV